jgi:hypothetical protein
MSGFVEWTETRRERLKMLKQGIPQGTRSHQLGGASRGHIIGEQGDVMTAW